MWNARALGWDTGMWWLQNLDVFVQSEISDKLQVWRGIRWYLSELGSFSKASHAKMLARSERRGGSSSLSPRRPFATLSPSYFAVFFGITQFLQELNLWQGIHYSYRKHSMLFFHPTLFTCAALGQGLVLYPVYPQCHSEIAATSAIPTRYSLLKQRG